MIRFRSIRNIGVFAFALIALSSSAAFPVGWGTTVREKANGIRAALSSCASGVKKKTIECYEKIAPLATLKSQFPAKDDAALAAALAALKNFDAVSNAKRALIKAEISRRRTFEEALGLTAENATILSDTKLVKMLDVINARLANPYLIMTPEQKVNAEEKKQLIIEELALRSKDVSIKRAKNFLAKASDHLLRGLKPHIDEILPLLTNLFNGRFATPKVFAPLNVEGGMREYSRLISSLEMMTEIFGEVGASGAVSIDVKRRLVEPIAQFYQRYPTVMGKILKGMLDALNEASAQRDKDTTGLGRIQTLTMRLDDLNFLLNNREEPKMPAQKMPAQSWVKKYKSGLAFAATLLISACVLYYGVPFIGSAFNATAGITTATIGSAFNTTTATIGSAVNVIKSHPIMASFIVSLPLAGYIARKLKE